MRRDSRLSVVLHILIHMADAPEAVTSDAMAAAVEMNSVVIRRALAGLRESGFVHSEKGHGGGWTISCDPRKTTLLDIYKALDSPELFAMSHRTESPDCIVEQAVNAALDDAYRESAELLLNRFQTITLAQLHSDFKRRYNKQTKKESCQ